MGVSIVICEYQLLIDAIWMPILHARRRNGMDSREELLTFEEIERLASLLVNKFGIESIRLTGGEPTVRANLSKLIEKLSKLDVDLSLTTNGATLPLMAGDLYNAGLDRINISLDTLDRKRFESLTSRQS